MGCRITKAVGHEANLFGEAAGFNAFRCPEQFSAADSRADGSMAMVVH